MLAAALAKLGIQDVSTGRVLYEALFLQLLICAGAEYAIVTCRMTAVKIDNLHSALARDMAKCSGDRVEG